MPDQAFWNDPATVEQFASRDPDMHLVAGLASHQSGPGRVGDLGAAGGRNTEYLARAGHRVLAIDTSTAMLHRTRRRCRGLPVLTLRAEMARLPLIDSCLDGLVAIGIYHQAESDDELLAALRETRRVLPPGGWLLAAVFSTEMLPPEAARLPGQQHLYRDGEKTVCRLSQAEWLERCAEVGLIPDGLIETRPGPPDSGRRTVTGWLRAVG